MVSRLPYGAIACAHNALERRVDMQHARISREPHNLARLCNRRADFPPVRPLPANRQRPVGISWQPVATTFTSASAQCSPQCARKAARAAEVASRAESPPG